MFQYSESLSVTVLGREFQVPAAEAAEHPDPIRNDGDWT